MFPRYCSNLFYCLVVCCRIECWHVDSDTLSLAFLHTDTHTRLTALFPGLPRWAGTRKAKPIWILLKQETVTGSGISWAICKSAPSSRQITMPAPHHSGFYRPDALPVAQPTASKHWRHAVKAFSIVSGSQYWPFVHQHRSPSGRWCVGIHNVSSSDWMIMAMHKWPSGDLI